MSSLKDLASLIMVPSLYKDGELHTVKPLADENIIVHPDATDNNDGVDGTTPSTSSNFTFSRGSNLAATRVDVNGLIEKGRENLLLQSNQFDTTWVAYQSSITGSQSGYDGTNNAWKLARTTTSPSVLYQTGLSFGLVTFSLYAKAAEDNWIYIEGVGSSGIPAQYFDLQNGVKGTASGTGFVDSTITSIGSGWHRITITLNVSGGYRVSIYNATADNTLSGTIGNGAYIQDAQLEQGLVATDYIETGTSAAQSGILEDMPRLDYSGGASCPSLLLEPQRTNVATHSEYLNASSWSTGNLYGTLSDNAAASPEGSNNAASMVANATNNVHYFDESSFSATSGLAYTFSFFVKSNGSDFVQIATSTGFLSKYQNYNISTGQLAGGDAIAAGYVPKIEAVGSSGWYRVSLKATNTSANARFLIIPIITDTTRNPSFVGNGDGIYIWGIQKEQGSYPTSYIPTYGTSQTRSGDYSVRSNMQDFVGTDEGSWFMHFKDLFFDITGTGQGSINLVYNSGNQIEFLQRGNFQYKIAINNSTAVDYLDGEDKVAVAWSTSGLVIYINGVSRYTSTSSAYANPYSTFELTRTDRRPRVDMKQILFFPTRLTNAELAALTTI